MMADVIVSTMHDPLDVVTEKVHENADTQQTAKENMTEKLDATAEGADSESTTMEKEAQLDAAALGEDDASLGVRVESEEHAKDDVEHDAEGAHETSKDHPDAEATESEEPTSKEEPFEAVTEKVDTPVQSMETGDTGHLDGKVDGEADTSPGVYVEVTEHAKDDGEHAQDSAHETAKGQSEPEVPAPEDSVPKENTFEAFTGKAATTEGTHSEDITTVEEEQFLDSTENGKDDTTPAVGTIDHTKDVVDHAEDIALREEQQSQQGQDKPNSTSKEPSLDDSNPYGLDTAPKGVEEGVPTGEVTTRVEQHPVVLEDVKPISDVEDTQAQAQGEDSPADEPLAVEPSEPVSDAKVAEDIHVQASEYPADHATTQDESHADATEEVKHQDESVEGEAVDETPVSLEDKTAKEEPVEAVEEKEEATGEADEIPSTTTIVDDPKASEEESVVPTAEPESQPQFTFDTASEPEKTEPTEQVSVEPTTDVHEEEEKHAAEAEGGTHVAPIADPVDHQDDPGVEGTKDAAEVIGEEESGEPSDSTTQHDIDASEPLVPPPTAEPQSETVVETEETEEKSADAGELGEASEGTKEDHPPEELTTTEPEKDESVEVQKDDGHNDVREVPPTHALASEASAAEHVHEVEEETRETDEVLDDQPTDAEVNTVPKRSDGGEEPEEKGEPSHEEQIGEDVKTPGNEDAPTEQATAPSTENDEVPEGALEHSPLADDVPATHHRQEDSTEETEASADMVESSPSAEETKHSIDVDRVEHDMSAEVDGAKASPTATEPELESKSVETETASHVTEDNAPAPPLTESAKEEASEPTTADTPAGSFDQTETEMETQKGDTPITSETAPPPTEEPRESDEAYVEPSTPAPVHEPAANAERTADEVPSVQTDHEAAVDAIVQADAVRDSATAESVTGVEAEPEKSEEAEDAAPAELDTVEPETKEVHNDAPSVAEDEIAEQAGELHAAEDAVTIKESDLSEVTQPETEESPAASDAPTHIEAIVPQPEKSDEDSVEELAEPVVSVAKEEEPNIPSAQLADVPTAGVVHAEDSAADPEIEPLTKEHKEKAFEAVPVDTKDEQVVPPEAVVESLTQVSEDVEAEPIAVLPVHSVEASSEEEHVEAVHSEAREETELEKPKASDEATGELTQPSEVAQEALVEVNQHTEPEPSAVPTEEEPQSEMKGPNDPEAELTASIEPPAPTETMASADVPSHSEDSAAFDVADVTNNEEVSPPAAEIPPAHEAVPGPSTAETLLDEEGQKNKEFGSALEVDSTTISEAVQDSKDEEATAAAAPEVTSLDNPEPSALPNTDPEKVENNAVLSASISESAHAAGEIVDPESTSTSIESGSTVQVEHSTEVPTITANKEAVTEVDSQEDIEDVPASLENEREKETTALGVEAERSDSVDLAEEAVRSVDADSNNDAVEVEDVETAPLQPYSGLGEQEITAPSQEQDAEGQAPETVKELVEGEKDVVALTAGQEEAQPPEEEHSVAELPADKDLAVQEPLDEAHKELHEESAPEPAGAGSTAMDEATGAVADAVRSTTDQTGRLIVPETLELVSGDNAKATEETAHADEEQPSTPAALEETTPHASREDLSAGTHEQSSESATEAGISEESVPEVTIELPTPSNENFTYEDELNSSDTEELPDVLEKDIPSVTTAPESAYQARSTPTIVIPEVSNSAERTEGESASPKESTSLGNETPTAVHEIDEAATTPTEPLVEASRVSMAEQSDDAIHMQTIENPGASTDVTEANVHEAALEHSVEEISSQSQVADLDKHEAEHAESILDSAQEYDASEPSVIIDVQEATTDATSSESLDVSKTDVPPGSPRVLSVDTSVHDLPERPKSPWTPSYSVTQQGPGIITQPAEDDVLQDRVEIGEIVDSETDQENETQIDEDVPAESEIPAADPVELQKNDIRTKTPENIENHSEDESVTPKKGKEGQDNTTPTKSVDNERPKSPYPPSYSVTQMGQRPEQGDLVEPESEAAMFAPLARKLSEKLSIISPSHSTDEEEESMDGSTSEAASDVPEVPISPRSDLGIFTPSFDSRSEISVASHEPIAPSSPRIDPEEPIFPDSAMRTPVGKAPAHVDAADSALSTAASESITPLPAPLVPLQGVYMTTTEVKEPEVSVAEEPGSDPLEVTVEIEDAVDNDDGDKSVISESLSGLTTDSDIEAVSTDGRLTTIPPSEARSEIDSEVNSSAFDGDIESHHPASSADSMDSDPWAQDTDVDLTSLPDTDSVHAEQGRASSEAEQSEPEIVQSVEASQSGSEISESEAHESPVLVATPKTEPAPSEADSEFEAISNPGIALTVRELSDSMSELDTIRDDSTFAGPIEDMPDIPSSVSQLAIPESDEGSGAPTPRPESPTADSSLSLDYADSDANASFDFVSAAKNTETEPTTADEEDNTLMMPKMYPQQSLDNDTGSIEPLDDDTVRQHLSDAPPSPAEPAIVGQSVESEPALLVNKQLPELPVFPTIVTPSEPSSSVSPKSFPGGLVALDEESSVSDFIPVSPTLGVRRRLESTASSLVFPGAWVVSPVPPERASLEVATGEFSRPPPGEFSRSNSGASPDSTPLVTPTTEDEEKRRCIIM